LRPLTQHKAASSDDLLVGVSTSDDAGIFRVGPDRALVQTVDFFTPIVDDAYDWGRIAAANALSDVYAMGGQPLTALQLVGWPRDDLPFDLLSTVIEGGADVMALAGTTIVGGHSIDDKEPKYGFAVTGLVDPKRMTTNAAARPGDVLVLTKPLGTGVAVTALKRQVGTVALVAAAVELMMQLNADAAEAMVAAGVRCATDVTGYGLLGHLREVITASNVSARIQADSVPVLDGIVELVELGVYPSGSERNLASVRPVVTSEVDETTLRVLADAQTSGGLLISVNANAVDELMARLEEKVPGAAVVGEVVEASGDPGITVV